MSYRPNDFIDSQENDSNMFSSILLAALLHPSHETFSELEWNPETGHLEVAMRLDVLDEQWLKRKLQGEQASKDWIIQYLQKKYRTTAPPGEKKADSATYHWIGREEDGSHVWWYFEIEPRDHQKPTWIDVRVLFEREKNYTHQVVQLDKKPRRSLMLTSQLSRLPFEPRNEKPGAGTKLPPITGEATPSR
ncbi:hypothetical protein N9D23_01425 [Rubripirellula sp.]|nr:hypothetical protein [Rubripirellula sp.]